MRSDLRYNIIATGSQGNALILNDAVMIDCGVPFKCLKPYYKALKLVLLTHIHADHFCKATIRRLARERPSLRFGCGPWLVDALVSCGVNKANVDVLRDGVMYGYGICNVIPIELVHNVPNCGYKLHFRQGKVFYATDTNNLNGITARRYDLYFVEANYTEAEIQDKIQQKKALGVYAYERQVVKNHLSKEKCDDFIYRNAAPDSVYVYMHCHRDREERHDDNCEDHQL
jgi:L-ascorbate metabolism protein UlaG (beta-lactamase superfamily)